MVTGASVQSKIYYGYMQAANHIGLSFNQFRPGNNIINPTTGTPFATLNGSFVSAKASAFNYNKAGDHDTPLWFALLDGRVTNVGDYFVGSTGTYFIAAMQPLLPILAVKCTHTINILRAEAPQYAGINPYGGGPQDGTTNIPAATAIITGFPAWVEKGKLSMRGGTEGHLPGDMGERGFEAILPPLPVQIYLSDIVTDDQGLKYIIIQVEKFDLGLRIQMTQTVS